MFGQNSTHKYSSIPPRNYPWFQHAFLGSTKDLNRSQINQSNGKFLFGYTKNVNYFSGVKLIKLLTKAILPSEDNLMKQFFSVSEKSRKEMKTQKRY